MNVLSYTALQHRSASEVPIMNDLFATGTHAFAPLYKEVRNLLTQGLAQGEWQPGEALPSESKLAQRFHVSIGTIRHAIDELVAEQILVPAPWDGPTSGTSGANRQPSSTRTTGRYPSGSVDSISTRE